MSMQAAELVSHWDAPKKRAEFLLDHPDFYLSGLATFDFLDPIPG